MSLDKNLFTLLFTPHKDNQNVIDLVDPSGTIHYRKQRIPGSEYKIEVYDVTSESLLAIATAPSATTKVKTIELCNPTSVVELKHTGTMSFKWSFKWEEHEFEWKREECYMIRKPDPPVIVAVTKEPAGRLKTTSAQILDYNLNRFDINDRKGLEIVILTALLTFQDSNEAVHSGEAASPPSSNPLSRAASAFVGSPLSPTTTERAPAPPPKPAPKTGIDRIAELQAQEGEYNEIVVSAEGDVPDYAQYCSKLLQDDAMLFITVKSAEAGDVPKVLQVVEETKRIRYKAGLDEEELHQYVLYDVQEPKKGPRRINLDDEPKVKYAPPKNLSVHLSKISMPELQPKGHVRGKSKDIRKDEKKATPSASTSKPGSPKHAPKPPRSPPKPSNPAHNQRPGQAQPPSNKLQRPGRNQPTNTPPNQQRIYPHQVHPNQPSPSPSQLNNPQIYNAPPPPPLGNNSSRPTSSYIPPPPSGGVPSFPQPHVPQIVPSWNKPPPPPQSSSYNGQSSHGAYNWSAQPSAPPPPGPPPLFQPQPLVANPSASSSTGPGKPASTSHTLSQGASSVVQGLMDKLKTSRR